MIKYGIDSSLKYIRLPAFVFKEGVVVYSLSFSCPYYKLEKTNNHVVANLVVTRYKPNGLLITNNDVERRVPVPVHGVYIRPTLNQQLGRGRARESKHYQRKQLNTTILVTNIILI